MAEDEDNGRLYMGLDLAFDKDHRARAIERGEVTILTDNCFRHFHVIFLNEGSF